MVCQCYKRIHKECNEFLLTSMWIVSFFLARSINPWHRWSTAIDHCRPIVTSQTKRGIRFGTTNESIKAGEKERREDRNPGRFLFIPAHDCPCLYDKLPSCLNLHLRQSHLVRPSRRWPVDAWAYRDDVACPRHLKISFFRIYQTLNSIAKAGVLKRPYTITAFV